MGFIPEREEENIIIGNNYNEQLGHVFNLLLNRIFPSFFYILFEERNTALNDELSTVITVINQCI